MIINGKNINLRTVEIADAEFIFNLRQNTKRTEHLNKIDGTIEDQQIWIKNYKTRENENKEFYFVIESKKGDKLGLVRVYDLQNDSFCWGSWLIKESAPKSTAIESALQIYEFGFKTLNYHQCHFDVRKNNEKVIAFHQRFGAKITNEDNLNYYFNFSKETYNETKSKYKRYLDDPIS